MKKIFTLILGLVLISMTTNAQDFEGVRFEATFTPDYTEDFQNWDEQKLIDQWIALDADWSATFINDEDEDYCDFLFPANRILLSKKVYTIPYVFESNLKYAGWPESNRGGMVIRANPDEAHRDRLQDPHPDIGDPGFNHEGIAFYPSADWESMIVQITGEEDSEGVIPFQQFFIPRPDPILGKDGDGGKGNLWDIRYTLRIEDYGSSIYVYWAEDYALGDNATNPADQTINAPQPYIRIDLGDMVDGKYTSGTVYDGAMEQRGTFSDIPVDANGQVSNAIRDANNFRLFYTNIEQGLWVNSAPTDIALSSTTIDDWFKGEDMTIEVATLSTTDEDDTDSHAYSLVSGEGDRDNGSFTIDDNKLVAAETGENFDFNPDTTYLVRIQTNDGGGGGTFSKSFEITVEEIAAGIKQEIGENVSIYPNPTTGVLYTKGLKDKFMGRIYNSNGQLMRSIDINSDKKEINVSELSSGIYIIKFINDEEVIVRRFAKE